MIKILFATLFLGVNSVIVNAQNTYKNSFVTVDVGPGLPLGDFSSTDVEQGNYAKTGVYAGLNGNIHIGKGFGLGFTGFVSAFNQNNEEFALNISQSDFGFTATSASGGEMVIGGVAIGPSFSIPLGEIVSIDLRAMGGYGLLRKNPEVFSTPAGDIEFNYEQEGSFIFIPDLALRFKISAFTIRAAAAYQNNSYNLTRKIFNQPDQNISIRPEGIFLSLGFGISF
jgi:hypothetical protein